MSYRGHSQCPSTSGMSLVSTRVVVVNGHVLRRVPVPLVVGDGNHRGSDPMHPKLSAPPRESSETPTKPETIAMLDFPTFTSPYTIPKPQWRLLGHIRFYHHGAFIRKIYSPYGHTQAHLYNILLPHVLCILWRLALLVPSLNVIVLEARIVRVLDRFTECVKIIQRGDESLQGR